MPLMHTFRKLFDYIINAINALMHQCNKIAPKAFHIMLCIVRKVIYLNIVLPVRIIHFAIHENAGNGRIFKLENEI